MALIGGAVLSALWICSSSRAELLTVEAQAAGASRANAISAALVAAVEQVSGLQIEANSALRQEITSNADGEARSVTLSEGQQVAIRRQAGGVIKGYDVIGVEARDGGYTAILRVSVERFSAPGLPTQDRRRIVIATPSNLAGLQNAEIAALRDALEAYLTQTRRFAVLDRQNEAIYRSEMDLLRSPDVPIAEAVRLGQVIGADFLVKTKLRRVETSVTQQTLPITREQVIRQKTRAQADFIVLDVASRQIKWAGQVSLDSGTEKSEIVRQLADEIGAKVVSGIYPLRVIQVLASNVVVVNQGAQTIRVGEIFSANRLGDMAIDPYTKEPLGQVETPVATVRISRVDPKLSYGEVVTGALPPDNGDLILRPVAIATKPSGAPVSTQGTRPKW